MTNVRTSLCRSLPLLLLVAACAVQPDDAYSRSNVARRTEVTAVAPAASPGVLGGPPAYAMASAGALSGSSMMPAVAPAPAMPMRMSANEILGAMANNTAAGTAANGSAYYAYFSPTGEERFREGDFRDVGAWRVLADGRFCTQLSRVNNNGEQCYILYRSGTLLTFQYLDGSQAGTFALLAGNPQSL